MDFELMKAEQKFWNSPELMEKLLSMHLVLSLHLAPGEVPSGEEGNLAEEPLLQSLAGADQAQLLWRGRLAETGGCERSRQGFEADQIGGAQWISVASSGSDL